MTLVWDMKVIDTALELAEHCAHVIHPLSHVLAPSLCWPCVQGQGRAGQQNGMPCQSYDCPKYCKYTDQTSEQNSLGFAIKPGVHLFNLQYLRKVSNAC